MKKTIYFGLAAALIIIVILTGAAIATASPFATSTNFDAAKTLINQKLSCQQLSATQLESIGDYYMEQMMPGEAHKNMDQMMGGEGSETLKQMHILMARHWYCGDSIGMGMMAMMMGRNSASGANMMSGNNITSGSIIGSNGGMTGASQNSGFNMMGNGYGMMGLGAPTGWGSSLMGWGLNFGGGLIMILIIILLITGIAAMIKYLLKKGA